MLYSLLRPALFSLDPEDAHSLTLSSLDVAQRFGLLNLLPRAPGKPLRVMGIDFPKYRRGGKRPDPPIRVRRILS